MLGQETWRIKARGRNELQEMEEQSKGQCHTEPEMRRTEEIGSQGADCDGPRRPCKLSEFY